MKKLASLVIFGTILIFLVIVGSIFVSRHFQFTNGEDFVLGVADVIIIIGTCAAIGASDSSTK